jgi:hypothetical protein
MSSFSPSSRRPVPTRPLVACALLAAAALDGACTTEDVHARVLTIDRDANSHVAVYLIRDDAPYGTTEQRPIYRVTVDGSYLTGGEHEYVQTGGTNAWDIPVAAGVHMASIVDEQGSAAVASPVFETKPFVAEPLPSYHASVVFFGSPSAFLARVLIDDPATLPAGAVHLRVVNAFGDHRSLQIVQCLADLDAIATVPSAGTCTAVGDPIPYGDVFETDAGADVVNKVGFEWAGPGAVDAAVAGINAGGRPHGPISAGVSSLFVTRIPMGVVTPSSSCPMCVLSSF